MAQALRLALAGQGIAAEVLSDGERLTAALDRIHPDVIVMDLDIDSDDPCAALRLIGPAVAAGFRVVVLTGVRDRRRLACALEAGACGVVGKHEPMAFVVEQIARAADGQMVTPVAIREELLFELRRQRQDEARRLRPFESLTQREREVFEMLCDGTSAVGHCPDTFVSVTTVRGHINSILRKLGVQSQLAAIAMAKRAGWQEGPLAEGLG